MFSRLSRLLVFLAAAQMLGGHWMALQSIAWARMVADYSRGSSLVVAIEKTFDGEHPCNLCHEVSQGRKQEQKQPFARTVLKFDAVIAAPLTFPAPQPVALVYEAAGRTAPARSLVPLTPPPRRA